jgi:hypothetical protein
VCNIDKRHGSDGVLVTDTHYTGGDRLLVEYKEGALQRCGAAFLSSPPPLFGIARLFPSFSFVHSLGSLTLQCGGCLYRNHQTTRSRRMAADYEISMMSFSGLPYRTHTLRY